MKSLRIMAAVASATLVAGGLLAAPSVEITNVQQQYPWTNTVDITYQVQGVSAFPSSQPNDTYFATYEAKDSNGNPIADVNGNTVFTNALINGSKTDTAQWQPAKDLQLTGCTMTPSVFRGEENAYMIVNLITNKQGKMDWWYEPMSTQEASNKRYNTDEYKTTKMVFRRVPKGEYWIGGPGAGIKDRKNSYHKTVVGQDYYIAVFQCTEAQWAILSGGDTSNSKLPKNNISWFTVRGSINSRSTPVSGVFAVMNEKTGLLGFDCPTQSMSQIAARAGNPNATVYPGGDTIDNAGEYAWYPANSANKRHDVGLKKPNEWGIYDFKGNVWELNRDTMNWDDLASLQPDALVPVSTGEANNCTQSGSSYSNNDFYLAHSYRAWEPKNQTKANMGVRFSYFPQTAQ